MSKLRNELRYSQSNFFDNSMNKHEVLARCKRWKIMTLSKSIKKLFTKSKFEEVVPFQHPFRGECKADFHAACRWIYCGNFCTLGCHYEARKRGLLWEKAVRKCCWTCMKMEFFQTKKHYEARSVEVDRYTDDSRADQSLSSPKNQSISISSTKPQEINQVQEGFQ